MKPMRAEIRPASFWTSCRHSGLPSRAIVLILEGFASILRLETTYPSSCPVGTPKVHFPGFSFILYLRRLAKVSARSASGFYHHVVDVDVDIAANLARKVLL